MFPFDISDIQAADANGNLGLASLSDFAYVATWSGCGNTPLLRGLANPIARCRESIMPRAGVALAQVLYERRPDKKTWPAIATAAHTFGSRGCRNNGLL